MNLITVGVGVTMTDVYDAPARAAQSGINALIAREAGYSVAAECLRVQTEAEERDPSLRTADTVQLHPDAWSWYQGALGEIHVGQLLASLGPEWRVLHSVPIGSADTDVDHILIGPNGVFVLNTKHHKGASIWVGDHVLRVNNSNTTHIRVAQGENKKVRARLEAKVGFPVTVRSVIVLVGERSVKDIRVSDARPVDVISSLQLVGWLTTQRTEMSHTQLELIRLAAEEPDTWHVDPHRADSLRVMQRFSRLVDAVGYAPPRTATPATEEAVTAPHSAPRRASAPRIATRRRTSPATTKAQSKRAQRRTEERIKAFLALGFAAIALIMVANGSWTTPVSGLISTLIHVTTPAP